MLKLLIVGALKDEDTKAILSTAFAKVKGAKSKNEAANEFVKVKVMIEGALTNDSL